MDVRREALLVLIFLILFGKNLIFDLFLFSLLKEWLLVVRFVYNRSTHVSEPTCSVRFITRVKAVLFRGRFTTNEQSNEEMFQHHMQQNNRKWLKRWCAFDDVDHELVVVAVVVVVGDAVVIPLFPRARTRSR